MAEVVDEPQQQEIEVEEKKPAAKEEGDGESSPPPAPPPPAAAAAPPVSSFSSLSLSIWPPSERTRTAVLNRLVETLSAPSVLSQRYGTLPHDEASVVARQIEEEAFSLASSSPSPSPDDDGMGILQIYSREISKRMLETVKARALAETTPSAVSSEDVSSVASESSQA